MNPVTENSRELFSQTCRQHHVPQETEKHLWGAAFYAGKNEAVEEFRKMLLQNKKLEDVANAIQGTN